MGVDAFIGRALQRAKSAPSGSSVSFTGCPVGFLVLDVWLPRRHDLLADRCEAESVLLPPTLSLPFGGCVLSVELFGLLRSNPQTRRRSNSRLALVLGPGRQIR